MATGIGITGRRGNALAVRTAKTAVGLLLQKNADVEVDRRFLRGHGSKPLSGFESGLIISFGGDGTLLETVRELKRGIPVLGINCGNRGFLQAYNHTELEEAILAVLDGKVKFEERTRILAKVDGKVVGEALNEVLVVPEKSGRLLKYRLRIGSGKQGAGQLGGIGSEREEAGDGLIVATPTGSTAHALSAGGPVVKGNAAVFVVVSMSPVDWKHRPLVINDHEKVVVSDFGKMKAELVLDGQKWFSIRKKVELVKGKSVLLAMRPG